MAEKETVELTVVAHVPDLQKEEEALVCAFNKRQQTTAVGAVIPTVSDLLVFRLRIPVYTIFELHLFTRSHPDSAPVQRDAMLFRDNGRDLESVPFPSSASSDGKGPVGEPAEGTGTGHLVRAEWIGHLIVVTPEWRTVFVAWGSNMPNWMRSPTGTTDNSIDEKRIPSVMMMMMMIRCQKEAAKQRLKLILKQQTKSGGGGGGSADGGSPNNIWMTEKEFPTGSGCYWMWAPDEAALKPAKFRLEMIDQLCRTYVDNQIHFTWKENADNEATTRLTCCDFSPVAPFIPPKPRPRSILSYDDGVASTESGNEEAVNGGGIGPSNTIATEAF